MIYERRRDKNLSKGFPIRSDINRAVQLQNMVRGLKFLIYEVEGLHFLCSKNKRLICICKSPFFS